MNSHTQDNITARGTDKWIRRSNGVRRSTGSAIKSPGRRGMRAMLRAREVVIVQGHRYVVDDKGKLQFVRAQHPEGGYRAPWNESLTAEGQRLPRSLRRACAGMKRTRLRPAEKAARDALVRRDTNLTVTIDGAALDGVRSVEYGR